MTTENAVRELQSMRGLDNTGEVTAETWEAIRYLEQQAAIQYRYLTPYDALAQINYDLDHPEDGGPYSWLSPYGSSGPYAYYEEQYSQEEYAVGAGEYAQFAGQLSDDGRWRWDGYTWQSADGTDPSGAAADPSDGQAGQLSPDGLWRWDGTAWQPANADADSPAGYVGQLSPDGLWRWDGSQWQAA
jgi:hypothetical protein